MDAVERDAVAGLHLRQLAAFVFVFLALAVLAFLVDGQKARHDHRGARRAETVLAARREIDGDGVERGRDHLRGDGALPDQFVEAPLVVGEEARDLGGRVQRGGRAHGFVGFLRVLGLGLVDVGLVRQRCGAEIARDDVADLAERILRQAHRVGTHIGDQADRALVAERDALVELLRDLHRTARGEAELARGFLLQRRRRERRRRTPLALLAGDIGDVKRALRRGLDARARRLGGVAVGDGELLELLPVEAGQARGEALRGMRAFGLDAPVLAGDEGFDLLLALDDHAQRRALHAARGQTALDLAPQHRRQVEADEIVQRAPRLLGVDEIAGDRTRLEHRFLDRARRDLGEHHALQRAVLEQAALFQDLRDVPADGLTLAVRVGRQEDAFRRLRGLRDRLDVLFVLFDQVVAHREVVRRIDCTLLRDQIAHVAVRGQDVEVLAEVLVDRLGLRRRLDDEEVLGHVGDIQGTPERPIKKVKMTTPGTGPGGRLLL